MLETLGCIIYVGYENKVEILANMKRILAFSALITSAIAQPSIREVWDGGAYTANVAQGSVFVVKGSGLSTAGLVQAPPPIYPKILNNVQITFTPAGGGAAIEMLMVYTYNLSGVNQLAGVLPSTTPVGAYDVRVINSGSTSAPVRTSVVARKPGIVTADGRGSGPAQATLSGQLILQRTSNQGKIGQFDTRPAHAGDRVDLWGTGVGADAASDTGGTSGDQTAAGQIRVLVDGMEITPLYAGRSQGYPGLDQIVFNLPLNVTLSCTNNIQVRAGGVLSNLVTIATSDGDTCPALPPGLTQTEIDGILSRGVYKSGELSVYRWTDYELGDCYYCGPYRRDYAYGVFNSVSGPKLATLFSTTLPAPTDGVCDDKIVRTPGGAIGFGSLDAGASLTVRGPAGSRDLRRDDLVGNFAYYNITGFGTPGAFNDPGNYTFTGPGGPQVGSFSVSVDVAPELVWTNRESVSVVTRANGVTVTWTGGEPTQLVQISGMIEAASGTRGFVCYARQSAGHFTVPASVLNRLPASADRVPGGVSVLMLHSPGKTARGQASGLDYLVFTSWSRTTQNTQYK